MIRYILFDLDNTLYPASSGLDREIDRLMTIFVADYLRISRDDAHYLRKTTAIPYGTTLQWLRLEFGFHDLDRYFEAVHPKNVEDFIPYDPDLPEMLAGLPLPKAVLTNSPIEHARRVLAHLRVENYFPLVFDIRHNRYQGKPYQETYRRAVSAIGQKIEHVLFVDDMPRYLLPFRDLGGQGVLVDEAGDHHGSDLPVIRRITDLGTYISTTYPQGGAQ